MKIFAKGFWFAGLITSVKAEGGISIALPSMKGVEIMMPPE
jgi:hypothetical protein